jgi:hypothetical protein
MARHRGDVKLPESQIRNRENAMRKLSVAWCHGPNYRVDRSGSVFVQLVADRDTILVSRQGGGQSRSQCCRRPPAS